jgi:hypothetical protein
MKVDAVADGMWKHGNDIVIAETKIASDHKGSFASRFVNDKVYFFVTR